MWGEHFSNWVQESLVWIKDMKVFVRNKETNHWQKQYFLEQLKEIEVSLHASLYSEDVSQLHTIESRIVRLQEDIQLWDYAKYRTEEGFLELPPLPYAYDALEPYIHKRIMFLHHMKHHQSYVDGYNKAWKHIQESRKTGDYDLIKHWERELSFHGNGHSLHTLFWNNMSPNVNTMCSDELKKQINDDFGSFENMKREFERVANSVEGSGWALLVYLFETKKLATLQLEKHQNTMLWNCLPLLACDVWEHAYYLQYENDRLQYVKQWWNVVNWDDISYRYHHCL